VTDGIKKGVDFDWIRSASLFFLSKEWRIGLWEVTQGYKIPCWCMQKSQ
jgi:hypothetical protein